MGSSVGDVGGARRRQEQEPPDAPPQPLQARALLRAHAQGSLRTYAVSEEALRAAVEMARRNEVPLAVRDLSLYTNDALEHELSSFRAKAKSPNELALLGAMEREVAKRNAPERRAPRDHATRQELEAAIAAEKNFLARYGSFDGTRKQEHDRHLNALNARRQELLLVERACDGAAPSTVATSALPPGAHEIAVSADDLIASLRTRKTLSTREEADVRTAWATWRDRQCLRTGVDPARFAAATRYAEANEDRSAEREQIAKHYLEIIGAIRQSPLATAAFLDSAARREDLGAAVVRVRGAVALEGVATSVLPLRMLEVPPTVGSNTEHREIDGLGQRMVDDRAGAGHATNTRFRGVDTSTFEKDPDRITYGPYRKNAVGAARTVVEAREIYEKQTGRKLPEWVRVTVDPKLAPDRDAEYVIRRAAHHRERIGRDDLRNGVVLRLRPEVLQSDESIVGHLTHEAWELEHLDRMLQGGGQMTAGTLRDHVKLTRPQLADGLSRVENLHGQAWDVADLEVRIMRATPGGREHGELLNLRDRLRKRLDEHNEGL